jgi:hypothetical protein
MTEPDRRPDTRMRGYKKITEFLREELDEPDLPESRVAAWARAGKIDVDKFGPRNVIATPERLRASLGKRAV